MGFILYALAFRLAIIFAGIAFMYFGYRLFLRGIMPPEGTGVDGQVGEVKLTLKNAAPGTVFALFGAVLICVMLWTGMPEYTQTVSGPDGARSQLVMRSGTRDQVDFDLERDLGAMVDSAQQIEIMAEHLRDRTMTLEEARPALLGLATAYLRQKRLDEAIALVRLVYQSTGEHADTLALMTHVEHARGDMESARQAAARLRAAFPSGAHMIEDLEIE